MKKTKKTMLTSALLSAAVALQTETLISSPKVNASAPLYGPPPILFGDLDDDDDINIVDYILMKSVISEDIGSVTTDGRTDLNKDGIVNEEDFKVFQRYLFGKIPDVQNVYPDDRDDNPEVIVTEAEPAITDSTGSMGYQTTYGPPATIIRDEPVQPVYGAPVTDIPYDYSEPATTYVPETAPAVTDVPQMPETELISDVPQCVYGPPSYFETLD